MRAHVTDSLPAAACVKANRADIPLLSTGATGRTPEPPGRPPGHEHSAKALTGNARAGVRRLLRPRRRSERPEGRFASSGLPPRARGRSRDPAPRASLVLFSPPRTGSRLSPSSSDRSDTGGRFSTATAPPCCSGPSAGARTPPGVSDAGYPQDGPEEPKRATPLAKSPVFPRSTSVQVPWGHHQTVGSSRRRRSRYVTTRAAKDPQNRFGSPAERLWLKSTPHLHRRPGALQRPLTEDERKELSRRVEDTATGDLASNQDTAPDWIQQRVAVTIDLLESDARLDADPMTPIMKSVKRLAPDDEWWIYLRWHRRT